VISVVKVLNLTFLFAFSVLLTFEIFSFHEKLSSISIRPELSLCARLFSIFDFGFAFDLFFSIFLRETPCLRAESPPWWVSVVNVGFWLRLCRAVGIYENAKALKSCLPALSRLLRLL